MTTFDTGRQAEAAAAEFLQAKGFKIIERNWRTRTCEIDIVAERDKTMHFVEVKYRRSDSQGSGLEYLMPAKLRQMKFAAESWVAAHDYRGQYCLAAIELSGPDFTITNFIESVY